MRIEKPGGDPSIKLKNFIDDNFDQLSHMGDDVLEMIGDEVDDELGQGIKQYLQSTTSGEDPFRYRGFAIYYVSDTDEVWVEYLEP